MHFDDSASATTGDSYTEYTSCSDDSVGDEDSTTYLSRSSYLSKSSRSLFASVFLRGSPRIDDTKNQYHHSKDEEEGSRVGASTVSSIRSRFTNGGNTHCATAKNLSNRQPTKRGTMRTDNRSKPSHDTYKYAATDRSFKSKNSDATDRIERHRVHKQEIDSKRKESAPPKRKNSREKPLSSYLQKQDYKHDISRTDLSFAGSKLSMEEVDLNSSFVSG